jgi:hypothetical protein
VLFAGLAPIEAVELIAGPVIGLFIGEAAATTAGFAAVTALVETGEEAEMRSLTLMVAGAGFAAAMTVIGWALFPASIFLKVSSTSAATHPAPVSVVFIVSRETPSFV